MADNRSGGIAGPKPMAQTAAPDASRAMTLFVMIVATLYFGKEVLMPITLAMLLAFVLAPTVNLLRWMRLGRVPSVLLGVILALSVVLAIGGVIGSQIAQLTSDLPRYAATVETKVSTVRSFTIGRLSQLTDKIGAGKGRPETASPASSSTPSQPSPTASTPTDPSGSTPLTIAERYLSTVLSPFATFGIVFIVAVFALLQKEDLRDRLIRLVGSDDLHRTTVAIDDGAYRLNRYFLTQLIINTTFGAIVGSGLLIIGVPNPVLWGILSALLRFVPYVGSLISAVLPVALAAAVEPGWSMMLWTVGLYLVIEGLTGQVVEPLVYGNSTGLSPFSVVVAAIFWSWLWGPVGLILSTPLTLCLVVVGRHVKRLEFLDVLLGDRPPLTLTETMYQSILAGDADEAQHHAELILKQRSLGTYYDEIVVKALQLAAKDAEQGIIDRDQLERANSTVKILVRELGSYNDDPPGPRKLADVIVETPLDDQALPPQNNVGHVVPGTNALPSALRDKSGEVLCVAGRGPLDEAASSMLVQLLGIHGMKGRLVTYDEVSRERIDTLNAAGAAIACISCLGISGNPAHLRYLIQRLRRRLPGGAQILGGIWPADDPALSDEESRRAIGADVFAASLEDAVTACVQRAIKLAEAESLRETAAIGAEA